MLLSAVLPVDHAETGPTQRGADFTNGDGIWASPVSVEVNERPDIPFLAEPISGVVVMGGVQADIPDRDVRVKCPEFPEGNNGADAVIAPGVQEADMQGQINAIFCIMGAEHVKGCVRNKRFPHHCPSPSVHRGQRNAAYRNNGRCRFPYSYRLYAVRGSMGMDAGAVAGKDEAVRRDGPVCEGREDGGKAENLLEPFLIMEREICVF